VQSALLPQDTTVRDRGPRKKTYSHATKDSTESLNRKELADGRLNEICGCDVIKGIIVVSLLLLAGLASAYTPEQQTTLDGMNLSYKLGMAYENALQGQNVAQYNTLVDEYNTWIKQNFGEDAGLLKPKLTEPTVATAGGIQTLTKQPFNASSALSTFGKQSTYSATGPTNPMLSDEENSQNKMSNF
jgi:hypothetical protein